MEEMILVFETEENVVNAQKVVMWVCNICVVLMVASFCMKEFVH